jgi:hypothetical protein
MDIGSDGEGEDDDSPEVIDLCGSYKLPGTNKRKQPDELHPNGVLLERIGKHTTGFRPKSATRAETRAETEQRLCKICAFATKIFDSNKRFCWLKRASLG